MILTIPVDPLIRFNSFNIDLDGVNFTFRFKFNNRWGRWTLDILNSLGDVILASIPMQNSVDLKSRFVGEGVPPGDLVIIDTKQTTDELTKDEFGNRFLLMYDDALPESV